MRTADPKNNLNYYKMLWFFSILICPYLICCWVREGRWSMVPKLCTTVLKGTLHITGMPHSLFFPAHQAISWLQDLAVVTTLAGCCGWRAPQQWQNHWVSGMSDSVMSRIYFRSSVLVSRSCGPLWWYIWCFLCIQNWPLMFSFLNAKYINAGFLFFVVQERTSHRSGREDLCQFLLWLCPLQMCTLTSVVLSTSAQASGCLCSAH